MEKIIIVGNSTTAETVYNFATQYKLYDVVGFAVNKAYHKNNSFLSLPNFILEDLNPEKSNSLFVAIQWNRLNKDRKTVFQNLKNKGFQMVNIISPYAIVSGEIQGSNCWIGHNTIIDSNSIIGDNVWIKNKVIIGPNTNVFNHVFIGMGSIIAGGCNIGDQTFIGINSTVFDEVIIGNSCLIGACSIVKRNLSSYSKLTNKNNNTIIRKYANSEEIECKLLAHKNIR